MGGCATDTLICPVTLDQGHKQDTHSGPVPSLGLSEWGSGPRERTEGEDRGLENVSVCLCVCDHLKRKLPCIYVLYVNEIGVLVSRPDHRKPLFLYGVVGQGVTGGDLVYLFLCGVLVYFLCW